MSVNPRYTTRKQSSVMQLTDFFFFEIQLQLQATAADRKRRHAALIREK